MRRVGYTNTVFTPITWSDNVTVGATDLNRQLRANMLALDNRVTPYTPSVVHWTPPSPSQTVSNGTKVFLGAPSTYVNMLQLSRYSPNLGVSVDVNLDVTSVTASSFSVEAALHMRSAVSAIPSVDINYPWQNSYKYRPYVLDFKGFWAHATNAVSGSMLGATQYAFWTGFRRHDDFGNDPFSLTAERYICSVSLAISATNGSIDTSNISWSLRFKANTQETVSYVEALAPKYSSPIYGDVAF
jgi:hypothetical protein